MTGPKSGHPLPASDEAQRGQVPERAEREKGSGEDSAAPSRTDYADPDGTPYRSG